MCKRSSSKLNTYFESLRSNVMSSIMDPVSHSSASMVTPSPAMAPSAVAPINPASMPPVSSMPSSGFDNYLSKLQNICTDANLVGPMAGGGMGAMAAGAPVPDPQAAAQYPGYKSALQSYNGLAARIQ